MEEKSSLFTLGQVRKTFTEWAPHYDATHGWTLHEPLYRRCPARDGRRTSIRLCTGKGEKDLGGPFLHCPGNKGLSD